MARFSLVFAMALCLTISMFPDTTTAQLRTGFYGKSCPVEETVGNIVKEKVNQTFVTIPATLRLFFHDCFVNGCDASVMIQSTPNNKAEKDHPDNLSLAGDGFDVVIKAKKAVDAIPSCKNKVSCADILALATRDVVVAGQGPWYPVELGRFDGLVSTADSVDKNLPGPTDKVDQLNFLFMKNNLSQADMIALSAAHTLGFAHCEKFSKRIYNFDNQSSIDPSLNKTYAEELKMACPVGVDPRIAINMDPNTPQQFDNIYFKNLQQGKGLFTSDQVLFTDDRTRPTVNVWSQDSNAFNEAFIMAMTKLGRVGVKNESNGNIRSDCGAFI